jgi:nucleoside-diphosphate-sugar epimerase
VRVLLLGGTQFIGRALAEALAGRGHDLLLVHRGEHEPVGWLDAEHLHVNRRALTRADLIAFGADVVVDTSAMTRADAEVAVDALPQAARIVVLSSMDVYGAYGDLLAGRATAPVPLGEESPVRSSRYPYRGRYEGMDDYEKLDVEDVYRARMATICRLPVVFGPHDPQRREEFILRRLRANRAEIPFGSGSWLWSRLHVHDAARALLACVETETAAGEVLNIGPRCTLTVRQWAMAILSAADSSASLVSVPDRELPGDLWISGSIGQHMLADSCKAMSMLGWRDRDPVEAVADSVRWHLAHAPKSPEEDWSEDEAALARART